MEVTDQSKAREALGLVAIVAFIEAGFMAFSWLVPNVLAGLGSESVEIWVKAESFVWVLLTVATLFPVLLLFRAVKESELIIGLLGAGGLMLALELYFLVEMFIREAGEHHRSGLVLSLLSLGIGLAFSLGLVVVLGKLGRSTPFAAMLGALIVVRGLMSLSVTLRAYGDELPPMWIHYLRSLFSIGIAVATGALALQAKGAASVEPNVLNAPVAQAPITEASGMRLVIIGVVLLVVGIGGSALSFSAASSGNGGGQYFVLTGAIASGLVTLVRGLTRLGKGG